MSEQQPKEKQSIFRKKALDRISSPEELDQYLTVTGPGVWLPLLAVVVLLLGGVLWMILGQVQVTADVAVVSSGGSVVCYVPQSERSGAGDTVTIAGTAYPLRDIGYAEIPVTEELSTAVRYAGGLSLGETVSLLLVDADLPEGVYTGEITILAIHPIQYIIN